MSIATLPPPPYYAVIFTSMRTDADAAGYDKAAARMMELAEQQPGFLGVESVRQGRLGITVSYWRDESSIQAWKAHAEHTAVRAEGRRRWYQDFQLRACRVERAYGMGVPST